MMTSARNLQSTHNEVMHLTIEPDVLAKSAESGSTADLEFPTVETNTEPPSPTQDNKPETIAETIRYQHDGEGRFSYVSPTVTHLLGYSEADFMANYRKYLTENPINRHIDKHIEACMQGQPSDPYEVEIYDTGQGIHCLEIKDSPVYDGLGHCIGVEGVMREMTTQKRHEKPPVRSLGQEMPVTPNPAQSLLETIRQTISLANKNNKPFVLFYLSMDRIRLLDGSLINDSDNEVLNEASKRLRATLRDTDTVIGLEVDKFVLILPETDAGTVGLITEKIRKILQVPYLVGIETIVLDAAIGSAVYPGNNCDPEALLSQAKIMFPDDENTASTSDLAADATLHEDESLQLQQDLVYALDECKVLLRGANQHNSNAFK